MANGLKRLIDGAVNRTRRTVQKGRENLTPNKLTAWVDKRVGFTNTMLKPAPSYSLNPFYWLGALAFMAFCIQVITGTLMLLYYIPTPDQAYSSTVSIMTTIPFGALLETVHLYGSYAMILLAFLHLMRGYFASAHKSPRELMWVVGMLMGVITLAMGLTGYLLPWTVVSKSATDVSVGFIGLMPPAIGNIVNFLVAGTGSDTAELTRFFDLHVLVLPMVLILLFASKMYMFETHGASEPTAGIKGEVKYHEWFPTVLLYLTMVGGAFIALLLTASVLVPLHLPPEYSVAVASHYTAQPDWYFLAMYQILKLGMFAGANEVYGMGVATLALILLVILPFVDRNRRKNPRIRPIFTAIGLAFIVELLFLTVWGYLTPGQIIPVPQGVAGLVVPPVATGVAWWLFARRWRPRRLAPPAVQMAGVVAPPGRFMSAMRTPFQAPILTGAFVLLLLVGSVAFASLVDNLGVSSSQFGLMALSLLLLVGSFLAMARIVRRLVRLSEVERGS